MRFVLSLLLLITLQPLSAATRPIPNTPTGLYLELIKRCIKDKIYKDIGDNNEFVKPELEEIVTYVPGNEQSMMGFNAVDKLHELLDDVIKNNVPGDFIETGVWRGGLVIFMRAFLKVHNISDRNVWVADSFAGLPPPNAALYPDDEGLDLTSFSWLAVSLEQVKANFRRYGLLDDQVRFLKGWFSQTLPTAPIEKLAILRLDGDLYESTMDALVSLYPKLSVGGYIIVDDYGAVPACAKAVEDYCRAHNISKEIHWIDWTGVYWQKQ